jgi:hypothetical protein
MAPQTPVSPGLQAAYKTLRAAQSSPPTPHEAALLAIITLLVEELHTLHQQVAAQTARIDALSLEIPQPTAAPARRARPTPPQPPAPPVIRSMDYWLTHIPDYDGALTAAEIAAFRTRPRIRPEEIQLTAADLARQQRNPYAAPWTWEHTLAAIGVGLAILVLCILGVALLLGFFSIGVRPFISR